MNNWRYVSVTIATALLSLVIFWLPFAFKSENVGGVEFGGAGMDRIVANFDGLNFVTVAKTAYDPTLIERNFAEILNWRAPGYFAAHYPLFPGLIALLDIFLSGPNALLTAIVISNALLAAALYYFFASWIKDKKTAAILAAVALFIPARMLAVRAVGSNEPLFIALLLGSLIWHKEKRYWLSALAGAAAVLTRSPGILLFAAYFISAILENKRRAYLPYLLIPLALIAWFAFYGFRLGSFWAYFQVGGNINLEGLYSVFRSGQAWVSGIWLEDIIWLWLVAAVGLIRLVTQSGWKVVTLFALIYFALTIGVAHRDLARYSLPIFPMVLLGYRQILNIRQLAVIGLILLVPVYLYAWQFVLANYQPISNWAPFL